jgi:hypothetical protein
VYVLCIAVLCIERGKVFTESCVFLCSALWPYLDVYSDQLLVFMFVKWYCVVSCSGATYEA